MFLRSLRVRAIGYVQRWSGHAGLPRAVTVAIQVCPLVFNRYWLRCHVQ